MSGVRIAIKGDAGSGKDWVYEQLAQRGDFMRMSIADPVKEPVGKLINLNIQEVSSVKDGIVTPEIRQKLPADLRVFSDKELQTKVRVALQKMCTEVGRDLYPNVWVDLTLKEIEKYPGRNIVITDLRFMNEFEVLRRKGFKLVYLNCPDKHKRLMGTPEYYHPSERDLDNYYSSGKFDLVIDNNRMRTAQSICGQLLSMK